MSFFSEQTLSLVFFSLFFKDQAFGFISNSALPKAWALIIFPMFSFKSFIIKKMFIYMAMPGLNCGIWDIVPPPGIEPMPPALGAQ